MYVVFIGFGLGFWFMSTGYLASLWYFFRAFFFLYPSDPDSSVVFYGLRDLCSYACLGIPRPLLENLFFVLYLLSIHAPVVVFLLYWLAPSFYFTYVPEARGK